MSFLTIDRSSYPDLFDYAIFAPTAGLTFTTNNSIINNGYYGATTVSGFTPTVSGTPSYNGNYNSGLNSNYANAVSQLSTLINTIATYYTNNPSQIQTLNSNGTQTINPSSTNIYSIGSNTSISGQLQIAGGPDDQFFIYTAGSATNISFTNLSIFLNGAVQTKNIYFVSNPGGITIATPDNTTYSINGNFLSYAAFTLSGVNSAPSQQISGSVYSQTSTIIFGPPISIYSNPLCYLKGTKILTKYGFKAIEDLEVGDKVATKGKILENKYINEAEDYSFEPIKWIGSFRPANFNKNSFPICIKANAFGNCLPFEDLYVSPGHRIILDCKMVLAKDLINGETIFQDCEKFDIEYYHLELDSHSSLLANGILSESYLDFDTRNIFTNSNSVEVTPLPIENHAILA